MNESGHIGNNGEGLQQRFNPLEDINADSITKILGYGNYALGAAETVLDITGYIPFVSYYTSAVRLMIGTCQVVTGLALGVICNLATKLFEDETQTTLEDVNIKEYSNTLIHHGSANLIRGWVESQAFINLLCLGYDYIAEKTDNKNEVRAFYPELVPNLRDPRENLTFERLHHDARRFYHNYIG